MVAEFERLRQSSHTEHHCGHYSSTLHDFDLLDELGHRAPEVEKALGDHPFGDWPHIVRCYSRACPTALTWFSGFDNVMKEYLDQYNLRILGVAPAIIERARGSEVQYFSAIFLGDSTSPDINCINRNCTPAACQLTLSVDIHARALHVPPQQKSKPL